MKSTIVTGLKLGVYLGLITGLLYVASPKAAAAPAVPVPSPSAVTEPPAMVGGAASYVDASFGPRYLALPDGPGHRVRICGPAACVVRVSTDAGPDLAMQRKGRIADLSYADFQQLCGCSPPSVGLIRVTIEGAAAPNITPPPTDT